MDKEHNVSYLVEFKHAWNNDENKKLGKFNLDKWKKVSDQMNNLEKECANKYIDSGKDIWIICIYVDYSVIQKRT